jgi:hypothetical protein
VWLFFLLPPKWHPLEKVKILRTEISCDCVSKHKQTNKQAALAIKMNERRKWFAFSFLLCWGWKSRPCAHLSVPLSCIPAQQIFSVMTEFLENMGKLWGNVQNPTKGSPHEASWAWPAFARVYLWGGNLCQAPSFLPEDGFGFVYGLRLWEKWLELRK